MDVFSSGGGGQSTAALVLAAQGKIDYRTFAFCNVGYDSENPATLAYVHDVCMPFAKSAGIEFVELTRQTRKGETLLQMVERETNSIRIPVRMKNGAPGTRWCSKNFKAAVVRRWLGSGNHVVGIGFSLDEFHRMRTYSGYKNIVNEYPLIDLRLSRADCYRIVAEAGLPPPPKSACWFCPLHNMNAWREMRRTNPGLFDKAAELEKRLNEKRAALGRDSVWLTWRARPLSDVVADQPLLIPEEEPCDSGYCFL